MKVYFDESGQSGTHMLDGGQPIFALGSTNIEEAEASEILARCFPRRQGPELKAQNVLRRGAGRRGFLEFAKEVGRQPGRFHAARIDKRFVIVSKMVDYLVEPVLSGMGYDFYEGDYARRFANLAYHVFERRLGGEAVATLTGLYNAFARAPDQAGRQALQAALAAVSRKASGLEAWTLALMAQGAEGYRRAEAMAAFDDTNDVHVTAVVSCMGHWQEQGPGPYEVIHDESTHFFKRSARWKMMTDPGIEEEVIPLGDKFLRLPIPVISTTSARSHENASLQICDLLAGFVRAAGGPGDDMEFEAFRRTCLEVGLAEMSYFPIEPGPDLATSLPERARGPDIIDRIAAAVARRGS